MPEPMSPSESLRAQNEMGRIAVMTSCDALRRSLTEPKRTCVRVAGVVLAAALGSACSLPIASGKYEGRPLARVDQQIPVAVRSVVVSEANRDVADNSFTPVAFSPREVEKIERELRAAIEADLADGGPFRSPEAGEAAYQLDVRVEYLSMPAKAGSIGLQTFGAVLLGVPFLLGMPYGVIGKEGSAVFHLYAPDGSTLVHESMVDARKRFAIGMYYGQSKPVGAAAAALVRSFKEEVAENADPVLAKAPVERSHVVGAAQPPPVASAAAPAPASSRRTSAVPQLVGAAPQNATYLLAVGIDSYRDAPPAEGAAADAERVDRMFADTFHVPDAHRRVLLGDRATKSDIDKGLRWLASRAKKGSRVVVYFSGHGAPDPAKGTPYIVPYDGDPDDLAGTAIPLAHVHAQLGKTGAREALLVVDACFSGQGERSVIAKGARPLRPYTEIEPAVRVVQLAAATGTEIASATETGDGGVFTHYLLEALGRGAADVDGDGQITLSELETWMVPRVTTAAKRRKRKQTPQFSVGKKVGSAEDVVLGWGYPTE